MKAIKYLIGTFAIVMILYFTTWVFLEIPFKMNIGTFAIQKKNSYFILYHIDEFRDFDDLVFDFYRNDTLIVHQKYFDSTDGEPTTSDIKLRQYHGLYYVTCFDSTKVKIICDDKLNVIYPIYYGEKEDSAVSKIPSVKKMLVEKKLTLGRW
jgi:hypothetical protein